jgi:hypothetical protein
MIQIIFLFFGILAMIYLIIINKPPYENTTSTSNINIYPIDIQPITQNKKKILWKNNKKRKQKRKT